MIAYTILYATAVGLPTLLAAVLASSALRSQGKAERGVWLAALGLALALAFIPLVGSGEEALTAPVPAVETGLTGLPSVVSVPAVPDFTVPLARAPRLGLDQLLIGMWLLSSLILTVRWAVAVRRLARAIWSCPSETVDGVRVAITATLGPAVAGVLRPRILAPRWLLSMPRHQRSLVLAHEEEHVRAHDPWLIVASRVARILAPWNPLVWVLSSRLLRAVELDCDRRVLRRHPDIEAYGLTLLTVASRDPSGVLGAAAFAGSEAPLRHRILVMTTPPRNASIAGIFAALFLGALLIVGAFEMPIPIFRSQGGSGPVNVPDLVAGGTIGGVVTDASGGRPLEHVQLSVSGTGLGTLSNGDGEFLLTGVPAGEHEVVAERIGHGRVAEAVLVAESETRTVEFRLAQTAIALPATVVTEGNSVQFLSQADAPESTSRVTSAVGGRPLFTPHSVAPRVVNQAEVRDAILEAYGPDLRGRDLGGAVEIYLYIDADGRVEDYRMDRSSGQQALDDVALAAAGVYRFSPALNRDERLPVWVAFPIIFDPEE